MDITLLANYPNDENESMNRYAEMLKKLLVADGHSVAIIRPEPFFGRLKRSNLGLGKWLGYIDKYLLFPFSLTSYVREKKGTVLVHICDHSNGVYTRWLRDIPHLVTCHDVMAILCAKGLISDVTTGWTGRLLQNWILSGLKCAKFVVCITDETRRDLLLLAPALEDRSRTVELPLNHPYVPMAKNVARTVLSKMNSNVNFKPDQDRFLFHVGGNQWYKNREGVIRIFGQLCSTYPDLTTQLPLKLVMAGKPFTEAMTKLVAELGLTERVIYLASVSDSELCALYNLAEVLVYPSLKEGFGWPIIEAQACGCTVVTSNRAPMSRLAAPTSFLADPEIESDFAARIAQILNEGPEAKSLRRQGALRHSATFDPTVFVKNMALIYKELGR